MKKKFIDFMGLSDKDILEIKTGYRVIFKGILLLLSVAVPVTLIFLISNYFGVLGIVGYCSLGLVVLFFVAVGFTGWAQSIGQNKLSVKEVVTYTKHDGSTGSYVVVKKQADIEEE